jgi:outer membrane receptor protein involved in Fe transport
LEAGDRGSGYLGDLDYVESQTTDDMMFESHDFNSYDYKDLNEDFITANLGFNHAFDDQGHLLSGSLFSTYGYSMEYFENDLTEDNIQHDGQRSWEEEFRLTVQGKVDYVRPFKNRKGKFEAGYQYFQYIEDGDYGMNDYNHETQDFYFRDDYYSEYRFFRGIQALYGIVGNKHGNLAYQVGLRAEHTHRVLESSEAWAEHVEDRVELFPSGHVNYSFKKSNTISTSYSRRTVRPRLHFLEPYVTFADAYTARTGNPHVRPEYVNSFELGYQKDIGENFFSLETYYRIKTDKIERVRTVYEPNVTLDSISNVGSDYSFGVEFMGLVQIQPWWTMNLTGNLFRYRIESEYKVPGVDDESLNWRTRLSNSFTLGKSSRIQLDGNYVGPSVSTQGVRDAFYYVNLSIQQQLFDRKLSAVLGISDIFATAQYHSVQTGAGLESITSVSPKSPLFVLTVNYRFNRLTQDKKQGAAGTGDLFEGSGH